MASNRAAIAALALACALHARAALAQDPPSPAARATARALMDEGFDRRERGDLRGALESFRAADALVHVATTALEVARTEEALGQLVEARNQLEVIADSPVAPNEYRELGEARAAAVRLSEDLDARIPRARFALEGSAKDGASIAIDGEPIPRAARDVAHRLDPGPHVVVARTAAGREARVAFTLRERETRAVPIALPEAPPEAPPPAPPPRAIAPPPALAPVTTPARARDRTVAYVSFGAAGAGLLVGTIAGAVALAHRDAAASQCGNGVCPPSSFHDLDAAQSASTVSNAGFGLALVGAAVGVIDLLVTRDRDTSTARAARPHVSLGGAGIRGEF